MKGCFGYFFQCYNPHGLDLLKFSSLTFCRAGKRFGRILPVNCWYEFFQSVVYYFVFRNWM